LAPKALPAGRKEGEGVGAEQERVSTLGHGEQGGLRAGSPGAEQPIGAAHQTGWTALIADVIRSRRGDVETAGDILRRHGRPAQR
jgi:hypothetical protein